MEDREQGQVWRGDGRRGMPGGSRHVPPGESEESSSSYGEQRYGDRRSRSDEFQTSPSYGPTYTGFESERYAGEHHEARYQPRLMEEQRHRGYEDPQHESYRRRVADSGRIDYGDDRRNRLGHGHSQSSGSYTGGHGPEYGRAGQMIGQGDRRFDRDQSYGYGQGYQGHDRDMDRRDKFTQLTSDGFGQRVAGGRGRMERGQFYGRGPRGFSFSDEDIRKDVCRILFLHGDIDASEVEVKVQNAEVTLSGTVDDRRTKNLIEEVVEEHVHGVRDIDNQLRIKRNQGWLGPIFDRPEPSSDQG